MSSEKTLKPQPHISSGTNAYAISDIGQKRQINEDNVLIDDALGFYIVADGMGGHQCGEVASQLAVTSMCQSLKNMTHGSETDIEAIQDSLKNAINLTNQAINTQNIKRGIAEGQGMGTTITGFWYPAFNNSKQVFGFNLGDSRFYSFYTGVLKQISSDHSHYQLWLETGKIDEKPKKNIIYKALGPWKKILPDQFTHTLRDNELLLLCSDGLTDILSDKIICAILNKTKHRNLKDTAQALISIANKAGAKDNVSVLLFKL